MASHYLRRNTLSFGFWDKTFILDAASNMGVGGCIRGRFLFELWLPVK